MDHIMISTSSLKPLVAIAAGIVVLVFPRFLNYAVAAFFILTGLLGLGKITSSMHGLLESVVPIAAGVVILVYPRLLNTIVGVALILIGVLGLVR